MSINFREVWDTYVSSWNTENAAEKRALFEKCLAPGCVYNDPLIKTTGWDDLEAFMLEFQQQTPGGHFIITSFMTHSSKSVARWELRNGENTLLGDGISYAEYSPEGKLIAMTGFYETPEA